MPTIEDVARQAGVAPITVSRVINNSGYVKQEVRDRVAQAVVQLGYVPNAVARSLRSRRSNTLALVLTDVTNPFFTTVARGVEDTASKAGMLVILSNTDEQEAREREYLRMLQQQRVDGLLLVPAGNSADSVRAFQQQGIPVVILDRCLPGIDVDTVRCQSEEAAYELAHLLVNQGHRHTAILAGPTYLSTMTERIRGFRRALEEEGIAQQSRLYRGELTAESGAALARQALAATPRPTALLAANNFLAMGALHALQESGLRVPDEVSLVGFDDLPAALVTFPFLTVATQPAYMMGVRAVELLLRRLNATDAPEAEEIVLDSEIIVRGSSGRSPAG